jgi:hypothetical protein
VDFSGCWGDSLEWLRCYTVLLLQDKSVCSANVCRCSICAVQPWLPVNADLGCESVFVDTIRGMSGTEV